MEGETAEALTLHAPAKGISERGSPTLALDLLPHSYCIARAATLGCSFSPWRNMHCPGAVSQSMWGWAGHPIPKCTSDSNKNAHAGAATVTELQRELDTWGAQLSIFQSCSGNCHISKYLQLTRGCAVYSPSPPSHSLEKHLLLHIHRSVELLVPEMHPADPCAWHCWLLQWLVATTLSVCTSTVPI